MDWSNKQEVIEKVKRSAIALKKAVNFQDDYDVVLAAVSHCGMALEYASDRLKADRKLVKIAISNFPRALIYAPELKYDIELLANAYALDESILKYIEINSAQMSQLGLCIYQHQFDGKEFE